MERFFGVTRGQGFYGMERDIEGRFYWTEPQFSIVRQQPFRYLHLKFCYLGNSGMLALASATADWRLEVAIQEGWQEVAVILPQAGQAGETLDCVVSPAMQAPPDPRQFGIRIRLLQGVASFEEFRRIERRIRNARDNALEYSRGESFLTTTPPKLRIDMETRCNMMPRCVYCAWDYVKEVEQNNPSRQSFSPALFDELGDYYENALEVVNCNHGESLLSPYFSEVVERLHRDGKHFEFTTNGMLLDEAIRTQLLGKDIFVYVSLDAATAESYARYRNDRFELITDNIRKLSQARTAHGTEFPKIFVSFVLMRSNLAEVEAFLALCAKLGIDAIQFRKLNHYDNKQWPTVHRAGFEFCYDAERLTSEELEHARQQILLLNKQWNLNLHFMSNEQAMGTAGPCPEMWQSLYVMSLGYLPCCFGYKPLLNLKDEGALSRRELIGRLLNSPQAQSMRKELTAGRIPAYCQTVNCPLTIYIRERVDESAK